MAMNCLSVVFHIFSRCMYMAVNAGLQHNRGMLHVLMGLTNLFLFQEVPNRSARDVNRSRTDVRGQAYLASHAAGPNGFRVTGRVSIFLFIPA